MDLLNGYPQESIAYIGFFMTDRLIQKKGIGTAIVAEVCEYLKSSGFYSVQLACLFFNMDLISGIVFFCPRNFLI